MTPLKTAGCQPRLLDAVNFLLADVGGMLGRRHRATQSVRLWHRQLGGPTTAMGRERPEPLSARLPRNNLRYGVEPKSVDPAPILSDWDNKRVMTEVVAGARYHLDLLLSG